MTDLANPFNEMEVITALINDGMEQGYLTYDHILEALPDVEENINLLEVLLEEAQNVGITIYESEDDIMNGIGEGADGELLDIPDDEILDDDEIPHAAPLFDLSNVPIDDSVGLYFREMGQQQTCRLEGWLFDHLSRQ